MRVVCKEKKSYFINNNWLFFNFLLLKILQTFRLRVENKENRIIRSKKKKSLQNVCSNNKKLKTSQSCSDHIRLVSFIYFRESLYLLIFCGSNFSLIPNSLLSELILILMSSHTWRWIWRNIMTNIYSPRPRILTLRTSASLQERRWERRKETERCWVSQRARIFRRQLWLIYNNYARTID